MTAEEWRNGANEQLERLNLQPEGMKLRTPRAGAGTMPGEARRGPRLKS